MIVFLVSFVDNNLPNQISINDIIIEIAAIFKYDHFLVGVMGMDLLLRLKEMQRLKRFHILQHLLCGTILI